MRTRIQRQKKRTDEAQPSNYNLHPPSFPVQKYSSQKTNNHLQTSNSLSNRETDNNKSNLPHFSISAPQGAYDYLQKYSQVNNTLQRKPSKKQNQILERNYADTLIQSEKVKEDVGIIYKKVKNWYDSNPELKVNKIKRNPHNGKLIKVTVKTKLQEAMPGYKKFYIYYAGPWNHLDNKRAQKDYRHYAQENFDSIKEMITWMADVAAAYTNLKDNMVNSRNLMSEENLKFIYDSRTIENNKSTANVNLKSPFNRVAIEENIPLGAGISLTTSNLIEFLKGPIGIDEQNLLDTAAHALFAHWQNSRYKKHKKTHTFHETMFAKESLKKGNENLGDHYIREKLDKYPVEEMSRVLGWSNDYQKYVVEKQIMTGSDLYNQMKKLDDQKRECDQIKPLAKKLDEYRKWKEEFEKTKDEANKGVKMLQLCDEQVMDYLNEHNTPEDSAKVTWLRTVFKPMLDEQNSELKSLSNDVLLLSQDEKHRKQSDSSDSKEEFDSLLVPSNSKRKASGKNKTKQKNKTKFYSVINPKLEVSPEKAVISAKAAGATGNGYGHTIIYIEYLTSETATEVTYFTTDLGGEYSSILGKKGTASYDENKVEIDETTLSKNEKYLDFYKQKQNEVKKELWNVYREMKELDRKRQYNEYQRDTHRRHNFIQFANEKEHKLYLQTIKLQNQIDAYEGEMDNIKKWDHMKTSQAVKSWQISKTDAMKAIKKAYQVQEEVEIDNTNDKKKANKLIKKFNDKCKDDNIKYQGYRYSVTGGKHLFNFWSKKKFTNCARYGAEILEAAGVKIPPFKHYMKPTDLAPLLKP